MHQTGSLICNQHNELMAKMTILFLLCTLITQISKNASQKKDGKLW